MSPSDVESPARELRARLRRGRCDAREIGRLLDGLTHEQRVEAVRGLGRAAQRALYAAAAGVSGVRLVDLVPAGTAALHEVRHFGRNTLPAFTHFEKRFCRPPGSDPERPTELYGFNFQRLSPLTGPGYFVAREDPGGSEVLIDYTRIPLEGPQGWPPLRSNEGGLARLVYGFMVDRLRRVSEHVTIGSAARHGREIGSWFVLCREP